MRAAREKEQLHQKKGGKRTSTNRTVNLERRSVSAVGLKHEEKWRQAIEAVWGPLTLSWR